MEARTWAVIAHFRWFGVALALGTVTLPSAWADTEFADSDCPVWLASDLVHKRIEEKKQWLSLYGKIAEGEAEVHLGSLRYDLGTRNGKTVLDVPDVKVPVSYRRHGVQTHLFRALIEKMESKYGAIEWKVYNLVDTNGEVLFQNLLSRMKARFPELSVPSPELGFREAFDECCRKFALENLEAMKPLLWDSLRETPAYRTRAKLGYSRLCPDFSITLDYSGTVRAHLCR